MEFHLILKDGTQAEGVFIPLVEQLCTVAETNAAHSEQLVLNGRVQTALGERHRTHMVQTAPHIIDVGTQGQPVADIETQSAIHFADISGAVIGLGEMIIRAD